MTQYIPLQQYPPDGDVDLDSEPAYGSGRRSTTSHKRRITWRHPALITAGVLASIAGLSVLLESSPGAVARSYGRWTEVNGLIRIASLPDVDPDSPVPLSGGSVIDHLIQEATLKHQEMEELKASIDTLEKAVVNYIETFGMDPPEGFDAWYEFASSISSTRVPSLLPQAHLSILPYLSLPASLLRSRALELQKGKGVFGMTFHPDGTQPEDGYTLEAIEKDGKIGINNTDFMVGYMSPRWDYPDLLEPIIPLIPMPQQPEIPLQMTMCVRDGGCRLTSGWLIRESRKLAREGREWEIELLEELEAQYNSSRGWSQTCNPALDELLEDVKVDTTFSVHEKSFISDHLGSMDFCRDPDLIRLNGEMIMESDHVMRPLAPMLAVSKPMHGADMLGTPTRAVRDQAETVPWSQKTDRRIVWRGTLTGAFHRDRYDWRSSQRHRLSHLVGNTTMEQEVVVLHTFGNGSETRLERWDEKELVDRWMNVGLIKEDIHNLCGPGPTDDACRIDGGEQDAECPEYEPSCDQMVAEYQWVERMTLEDTIPYRYRLDVDGYGWSSRWQKLLSTNSVVIKSTVYPEWWTAQAIPWYHYVPLKYDYSELWDILFYFDGSPDDQEDAHEEAARKIAEQGVRLTRDNLRWEDMQSYMLLLLLEYRRAWSDDRQAASFRL